MSPLDEWQKQMHITFSLLHITHLASFFFFLVLSYIHRGESHWWMKGSTPPQIAEIIIKLIKDMAAVSVLVNSNVL